MTAEELIEIISYKNEVIKRLNSELNEEKIKNAKLEVKIKELKDMLSGNDLK